MGSFSNGTEGEDYQEAYCVKCRNYNDGECLVWIAHEAYQSYGNSNRERAEMVQEILDGFIPRAKNGVRNLKCLMFLPVVSA